MVCLTRRQVFAVGAGGVATLTGCSSTSASGPKFILLIVNRQKPYWKTAAAGFRKAAVDLNVVGEVVGPDYYDPKLQAETLGRLVEQKPAGILVSVADPALMTPAINNAIEQGVPVITIDADAPESKRLVFVGTDNYKAGAMGAEVAVREMNGKGNVVVYMMPEQSNLKDRLRGYQDVFKNFPGMKITEIVDVKGNPRIALDKTMEITEKRPTALDAFVCLESSSCAEVAEILGRKHISGKVVVSMDTAPRTLDGIRRGLINATIGQKPFTMAYYGLRMLKDLAQHQLASLNTDFKADSMSPLPSFIDTGLTLVTRDNVDIVSKSHAALLTD